MTQKKVTMLWKGNLQITMGRIINIFMKFSFLNKESKELKKNINVMKRQPQNYTVW